MTAAIRLAVIDDHPLFREGVTRSLSEMGFQIVGEGSTRDDALRIAAEQHPDIVLLDISMPGGGLNAVGPIVKRFPDQRVVMLTVSENGEDLTRALGSGAKGFVLKGVGSRALADILRAVAAGESYVSPTLSARVLSDLSSRPAGAPDPISELSEREREVLALVAGGLSNKRVAIQLDVHEKTVKHYMTRILARLGASNRTEAALAYRDWSERRRQRPAP